PLASASRVPVAASLATASPGDVARAAWRSPLALAGLAVVAAARLLTLPRTPWEYDEVLFVRGIERFDPLHHRPHPPGYPLVIGPAGGRLPRARPGGGGAARCRRPPRRPGCRAAARRRRGRRRRLSAAARGGGRPVPARRPRGGDGSLRSAPRCVASVAARGW